MVAEPEMIKLWGITLRAFVPQHLKETSRLFVY